MFLARAIAASRRRDRYRAEVLADNPIAFWRLAETSGSTAVDEMGNYNAFYVGSPTLGNVGPIAGVGCPNFANVNQYVEAPGTPIGTSDFTIELWAFLKDTTTRRDFYSRKNLSTNASDVTVFYNGSKFQVFERQSVPGASVGVTGATTPTNTGWYHICARRNGTQKSIYINGALDGTITQTVANIDLETAEFGRNRSSVSPIEERMSHVSVYNYALSATRIAAHYAAANP
jgi:hypothetical protein